ncbi:hypothetical protein [Methanonatronarchaeum sp. AMET-Sl]|uniref:hypothetical protein n=1 Tax=Methanonatronarchaeum sp. AMET-Sl TaxID=3037654 RepID=UPI00244DF40A|nr:hypothetical protein [Methanonatronarchaeum sp. AMET-Sl]WGI17765.1 hypothetical protein QEN48_01805 [Methanonatronarchaeum sp. AMET-Sl]
MEVKGNFALNIGGEETATLHIDEKQITINIKKITKTAKILKTIHRQTKQTKKTEKQKTQQTTEMPITLINYLNHKGYKIKIKIKGLTIIRNLTPSNLELINKFL